jgi:hypothetical protein
MGARRACEVGDGRALWLTVRVDRDAALARLLESLDKAGPPQLPVAVLVVYGCENSPRAMRAGVSVVARRHLGHDVPAVRPHVPRCGSNEATW